MKTATSQPLKTTRVAIVDDHTVIRLMLSQVMEAMGEGYQVVGLAGNAAEALKLCREAAPDLIMLDLVLTDSTGLDLLRQIKALLPQAQVLVFSGNLTAPLIRGALMAGAAGLIGKGGSLEEFREAIRAIASGRTYLCAETSERVRELVSTQREETPPRPALSRRELTVLRHIAHGHSSKEIAAKLGLSCFTISNYRRNLLKKTGLHRAVQLSIYATQLGLTAEPLQESSKHSA